MFAQALEVPIPIVTILLGTIWLGYIVIPAFFVFREKGERVFGVYDPPRSMLGWYWSSQRTLFLNAYKRLLDKDSLGVVIPSFLFLVLPFIFQFLSDRCLDTCRKSLEQSLGYLIPFITVLIGQLLIKWRGDKGEERANEETKARITSILVNEKNSNLRILKENEAILSANTQCIRNALRRNRENLEDDPSHLPYGVFIEDSILNLHNHAFSIILNSPLEVLMDNDSLMALGLLSSSVGQMNALIQSREILMSKAHSKGSIVDYCTELKAVDDTLLWRTTRLMLEISQFIPFLTS